MKYWRGYLVAAIFAAISWALVQFARAHMVLVDMIYPYITRMIISTLADWTSGMRACLWQVILIILFIAGIVGIVLMIKLRRNPIRLIGWVLAAVSCVSLLNTALYGLNKYSSPLADDVRLQVTDYTVSELNQAAAFFRDKANALSTEVARDSKGNPEFGTFEEMAAQAGEGYRTLTYQEAISVFAGSTVPVKKQGLFAVKGNSGVTVPLTGEAAVNPRVPEVSMPFAMCKEMAHRMSIYSEADANFSAFLACINNSSPAFHYSAYLMAYHYCYEALASIPTSTAQACASETDSGVNQLLRNDLEDCKKFYGTSDADQTNIRTSDRSSEPDAETSVVTFSSYSNVTDLLTSWYIQEYILPAHQEQEIPFDPYNPSQVDLSGLVNAKKGA